MRLAFAVTAHLEPELFMVNEVLAADDAAFRKKCLGGNKGELTRLLPRSKRINTLVIF